MAQTAEALTPTAPPSLSQRRIFLYWLPLAASWLLMASEMPYVNAMLARISEAERMIAAFGVVAAISITIESPVINLLSTSTAKARNQQHYLVLRRFTIHLMVLTTIGHVLMGFTPLFDLVIVQLMGVPNILIEPIRLGLQLMVPWSAAIAWRRFIQGILIRHGQTRYVGQGTIVRLLASAGVATLAALSGRFPGVAVGTLSLSAGVIVEAAYAHWVSRVTIKENFSGIVEQRELPDLSYRGLVSFHTPLAATSTLFLFTYPLIGAALARSPNPEINLAAWPVLNGLLFYSRAPGMALPEVVIALHEEKDSRKALGTFSLRMSAVVIGLLLLVVFTPLSDFYFKNLIGVNDSLAGLATAGARLGILLPIFMAWMSFYRGTLTARGNTLPVTLGMIIDLIVLITVLTIGVSIQMPGITMAVLAVTLSMGADALTLYVSNRRLTVQVQDEL